MPSFLSSVSRQVQYTGTYIRDGLLERQARDGKGARYVSKYLLITDISVALALACDKGAVTLSVISA